MNKDFVIYIGTEAKWLGRGHIPVVGQVLVINGGDYSVLRVEQHMVSAESQCEKLHVVGLRTVKVFVE
jgi:hypothetical protein